MSNSRKDNFTTLLQEALMENKFMVALDMCVSERNNKIIQENPWEILPSITTHLSEQSDEDEDKMKICLELLNIITYKCNPEDVVLVLHKELTCNKEDATFTALLPPLQRALIKIPKTKLKYSVWCFDAVQTFLNELPKPDNFNLEPKERVIMDNDPDVYRISTIYLKINEFYEPIAVDFKQNASNDQQNVLIKYMIQLLGQPIVHLDLECANKTKSRGRLAAENIVKIISSMCNPLKFLDWKKYKKTLDEDIEVKKLSIAHFYYLSLCEKIVDSFKPQIYNHMYILQTCLVYVDELFQHEHQFIVEKGIKLCQYLLSNIEVNSLPHELLDDRIHGKFCASITTLIILNPLKDYRQEALKVFHKYLFSFTTKGRYLLIYNLMNVLNHTGLMGYLVTQYKNMIAEEFNKKLPLDNYLSGPKLISMLHLFCYLHKKETSDLLELADQIVPSLNLLRYLAIRDKNNETKVWDHFATLKETYLEPLKTGLIMSKAHYEFKIKELEEEAAKGDKKDSSNVSITIAGQSLPNMSMVEKMNVLRASMTAFDVIESLLGRLNEFIDNE